MQGSRQNVMHNYYYAGIEISVVNGFEISVSLLHPIALYSGAYIILAKYPNHG